MVDALPHALFSGLNDFIFLYRDLQALYIILVICYLVIFVEQIGLGIGCNEFTMGYNYFGKNIYIISSISILHKYKKILEIYTFLLRIKLWRLLSGSPKSTLVQPYHVIRLNKRTTSVTSHERILVILAAQLGLNGRLSCLYSF